MELKKFEEQTILIAGDMMVDRYIIGEVKRISPEAPVPVLCQNKIIRKLGGAGNVAANAAALGARVRVLGRVGSDEEGLFFRDTLQKFSADDRYLFAEGNTIVKTRVSASNQQFLRIDAEKIEDLSQVIIDRIMTEIHEIFQGVTVIVLSDYAKGFLTKNLTAFLIAEAKQRKIPVLVDPKGNDISKYTGANIITPNNKEFCDLAGLAEFYDEEQIKKEALELCTRYDFESIILTRSEKGISIICKSDQSKHDYPAIAKEIIDVTGAGDTVVTTIALAYGAGFSLDICAEIANVAASIVISKFGAAQVTLTELQIALDMPTKKAFLCFADVEKKLQILKQQGKKVVFTNGCFDLLHAGHIRSFRHAKALGDVLIVGLNSDNSIRRIKGEKRPIIDLKNRMALLSALECVDFVIAFDEDTPQTLIEQIKPDILVKGKDWECKQIAGKEFVQSYGGEVVFIELEEGLSTTMLIEKIKQTLI